MRIAINAISVKEGGGIVAFEKLMAQFVRLKPEYEYHVIANGALPDFPCIAHKSVHRHQFEWAEHNYLFGSLWYLFVLPSWLRRMKIDVLFSQTSYLPLWGRIRSTILVQDPTNFWDIPSAQPEPSMDRSIEGRGSRRRGPIIRCGWRTSLRCKPARWAALLPSKCPPRRDESRLYPMAWVTLMHLARAN